MREAFAVQKLLTFFNKKYWQILDIHIWKFNKTLTIVSFEQPGPGLFTFDHATYSSHPIKRPGGIALCGTSVTYSPMCSKSATAKILISS